MTPRIKPKTPERWIQIENATVSETTTKADKRKKSERFTMSVDLTTFGLPLDEVKSIFKDLIFSFKARI